MPGEVHIAIIGDYNPTLLCHKATEEAVHHCANYLGIPIQTRWYSTATLEKGVSNSFGDHDGVWCALGGHCQSMDGALSGIRYARENGIPFLGTSGGFQNTVMEFAKNKLQMEIVRHADYESDTGGSSDFLISPLSTPLEGQMNRVFLSRGSVAYRYYSKSEIYERYECRFGLNPAYHKVIADGGLSISGTDEAGEAQVVEWSGHRFFVATLFQPQLSSSPSAPHSLIVAFMRNAYHYSLSKFLSK